MNSPDLGTDNLALEAEVSFGRDDPLSPDTEATFIYSTIVILLDLINLNLIISY